MHNIGKKKIGQVEEQKGKEGTVTRFFRNVKENAKNQIQKRTLAEITDNKIVTQVRISKKTKLLNSSTDDSKPAAKLGFLNDEDEILDVIDKDNTTTKSITPI